MPPLFTHARADRLDSKSAIPVREGVSGKKLQPGQAWIAPGDFHMTVVRRGPDAYLAWHQDRPKNSCRLATIDLARLTLDLDTYLVKVSALVDTIFSPASSKRES